MRCSSAWCEESEGASIALFECWKYIFVWFNITITITKADRHAWKIHIWFQLSFFSSSPRSLPFESESKIAPDADEWMKREKNPRDESSSSRAVKHRARSNARVRVCRVFNIYRFSPLLSARRRRHPLHKTFPHFFWFHFSPPSSSPRFTFPRSIWAFGVFLIFLPSISIFVSTAQRRECPSEAV